MNRIESKNAPAETRRMLRERLPRFLPASIALKGPPDHAMRPLISDKEIVDLYLNLTLIPSNDVSRSRELYETAAKTFKSSPEVGSICRNDSSIDVPTIPAAATTAQMVSEVSQNEFDLKRDGSREVLDPNKSESNSAEERYDSCQPAPPSVSVQHFGSMPSLCGLFPLPSFDELIEHGWIRISWERLSVPHDIVMAILNSTDAHGSAFKLLVNERGKYAFELARGFNPSGALHAIAYEVLEGHIQPREIACVSRSWIAARLWDTCLAEPAGRGLGNEAQRIGHWADRWQLLDSPSFAMSNLLDPTSFNEFVEATFNVLNDSSTTPGWDEFREAVGRPTALLYPHRGAATSIVSEVPETTVDRVLWMQGRDIEPTCYEYMGSRGSNLFEALLNELQDTQLNTRSLVTRLMDLVINRPVLLMQLVMRVRKAPALIADMLMTSSTCPLACSLVANWEFNGGGWNRKFQAHANHTTKLLAFEDALALLGGHLDAGLVPPIELAALYLHIYDLASDTRESSERYDVLAMLRQELVSALPTVSDSVVASLVAFAAINPRPTTPFCAALDLVSETGCEERIDPTQLVSIYLDVLLLRGERLGPRQLEPKSARSLVALVWRCDESLRKRFLDAIDVPVWLTSMSPSGVQEHTARDQLARRIRLHVRVLSRAIAGSLGQIPEALVEALSRAIHAGATDRSDRGRVDAFVPESGFGHGWATEYPIELDLAAALRKLQGKSLQTLLTQLCQVDEPIVLAGIVANTPPALNEQIKAHLQALTPANSSVVWSWLVLKARVDALLNAHLPEVAKVFVAAERNAETLGKVRGRDIAALRSEIHMLLLEEDWTSIASYALSENMSQTSAREAQDVLLFYRAIAELKKPESNPIAAEEMFAELVQRHSDVAAYQINLFASKVQRLLGSDSFRLLSGEALNQARRYLVEVEKKIRPLVQHSPSELKNLDINRVMLALAAGQPRESLHVLQKLREIHFDAQIEGFRGLALARLDRRREALALLMDVETAFGRSDFLSAIRKNIDDHRPYVTVPYLSLDDDPVLGIRQAFNAFRGLDHIEQAEVLQTRGRLDLYLVEEVRGACASVVALAPMLKNLGVTRSENDISSVLKHVLRSRLLLTQWAVEDQSRGGYSSKGNPGERDLIVSKGSVTLAVVEALIVDSVEAVNLTSHFNKLFSYDTCRFFFHITYAREVNCARIIEYLKGTCTKPPGGITYIRMQVLSDFDSMPLGFEAHYEIDSRDVKMTFLVLDMSQPIQRGASALQ